MYDAGYTQIVNVDVSLLLFSQSRARLAFTLTISLHDQFLLGAIADLIVLGRAHRANGIPTHIAIRNDMARDGRPGSEIRRRV